MILEMGPILKMSKHPDIQEGYSKSIVTPQGHILWHLKHIDLMDENGLFPHPIGLGNGGWDIPVLTDIAEYGVIQKRDEETRQRRLAAMY